VTALKPLALTLCLMAAPALALDSIGTVTARLGTTELLWNVLRTEDGTAMVQVNDIGPLTMIDLHALGDGNVYIGLVFQGDPAADVPPVGITIDMRPEGAAGPAWKSDGVASAPQLRFERLELEGAGRMEASFTAVLCRDNARMTCETVEGRIDTDRGVP
jgi:hypothetical protein